MKIQKPEKATTFKATDGSDWTTNEECLRRNALLAFSEADVAVNRDIKDEARRVSAVKRSVEVLEIFCDCFGITLTEKQINEAKEPKDLADKGMEPTAAAKEKAGAKPTARTSAK